MADPEFSWAPTPKLRVLTYNFHQNFIKMKEIRMGGLTGDPLDLPLQRKTFVLFSIARWLYFPFPSLDVAAARDAGEAADGAGQVTGRGGGAQPRRHRRSGAERPRRGARQVRLHLHGTKQNAKANFLLWSLPPLNRMDITLNFSKTHPKMMSFSSSFLLRVNKP